MKLNSFLRVDIYLFCGKDVMEGCKEGHWKMRSVVVFLVCVVVLLLILVLLVSIVLLNQSVQPPVYEHSTGKLRYRHLHYNPSLKTWTRSLVSHYRDLGENEYISFQDPPALISNFGSTEYQCRGTCICDDVNRRGSLSVSKGVYYLLVAASSVIAFELAEKHFEKECVSKMEDVCSPSAIIASVDDCEDLDDDEDEEEDDDDMEEYYGEGEKLFLCFGNCRYRKELLEQKYYNSIGRTATIDNEVFEKFEFKLHLEHCEDFAESEQILANSEEEAAKMFIFDLLHPLCKKNSLSEGFFDDDFPHLKPEYTCSGYEYWTKLDESVTDFKVWNPSVRCMDTDTDKLPRFWEDIYEKKLEDVGEPPEWKDVYKKGWD